MIKNRDLKMSFAYKIEIQDIQVNYKKKKKNSHVLLKSAIFATLSITKKGLFVHVLPL